MKYLGKIKDRYEDTRHKKDTISQPNDLWTNPKYRVSLDGGEWECINFKGLCKSSVVELSILSEENE